MLTVVFNSLPQNIVGTRHLKNFEQWEKLTHAVSLPAGDFTETVVFNLLQPNIVGTRHLKNFE